MPPTPIPARIPIHASIPDPILISEPPTPFHERNNSRSKSGSKSRSSSPKWNESNVGSIRAQLL